MSIGKMTDRIEIGVSDGQWGMKATLPMGFKTHIQSKKFQVGDIFHVQQAKYTKEKVLDLVIMNK